MITQLISTITFGLNPPPPLSSVRPSYENIPVKSGGALARLFARRADIAGDAIMRLRRPKIGRHGSRRRRGRAKVCNLERSRLHERRVHVLCQMDIWVSRGVCMYSH